MRRRAAPGHDRKTRRKLVFPLGVGRRQRRRGELDGSFGQPRHSDGQREVLQQRAVARGRRARGEPAWRAPARSDRIRERRPAGPGGRSAGSEKRWLARRASSESRGCSCQRRRRRPTIRRGQELQEIGNRRQGSSRRIAVLGPGRQPSGAAPGERIEAFENAFRKNRVSIGRPSRAHSRAPCAEHQKIQGNAASLRPIAGVSAQRGHRYLALGAIMTCARGARVANVIASIAAALSPVTPGDQSPLPCRQALFERQRDLSRQARNGRGARSTDIAVNAPRSGTATTTGARRPRAAARPATAGAQRRPRSNRLSQQRQGRLRMPSTSQPRRSAPRRSRPRRRPAASSARRSRR